MPDDPQIGSKQRTASGVPVAVPMNPAAAVPPNPGPANDKKGAEDLPPDSQFDLAYTDRRGRLWSGAFKFHVLTIRDRLTVGITRSRLAQGAPLASMDAATLDLLEMESHLAVAIDDTPAWWSTIMDGKDAYAFDVIEAVYTEVAKYERRFWGADAKASS